MDEDEKIVVDINNDLEKKIADVFDVFDHAGNRAVDAREVGTIIRALGCCPSEAEVQEMLVQMEDPESPGSVHLVHFLPVIAQAIMEHKYQPASPDQLLEAFNTLDGEKRGFLTTDFISTIITQDGEPFTQDELEEMLEVAVDPQTHTIPYEYYINQLMYEPKDETKNVYLIAKRIQDEKPPPAPIVKRLSQMLEEMQQQRNSLDI